MKTQVLVGIILIVITGLFAKYKLFDDKIELKYTLSDRISSDFSNNSEESAIQQLTIKNSGDVMINAIVIKINSTVSDYQVKKFRYTDTVSSSKTLSKLEIIYPELPPKGEFNIILKSISSGINKGNIEIYHSKGLAKEAFSNNESSSSILSLVLFVIYFAFLAYASRTAAIEYYSSKISYSPYDGILKRKKPWLISTKKWEEFRKDSIGKLFEKDYSNDIENYFAYQFLNSDKKEFLSDEEWNTIILKAENKLLTITSEKLYSSYYFKDYEKIKNVKKPKNVSHDTWQNIRKQFSRAICLHIFIDALQYPWEKQIEEMLKIEKYEIVNSEDWDKLRESLEILYSSIIIRKGIESFNIEQYVKSINLDVLDNKKRSDTLDVLEKIIEVNKLESYNNNLLNNIRDVLFREKSPNRPSDIQDEDWSEIEKIYNTIVKTKINSEKKLEEAREINDEAIPLKELVTKQLSIIDNLIKEPESIGKIEEYNIPFQKGNWIILKKISDILKQNKE